jgi:signal transduction histidine kinase
MEDLLRTGVSRPTIERQAAHRVRLIDDLFDVSRINRRLFTLRQEIVSVAPLLLQAVEAVKPALDRAGHPLETQLPNGGPKIKADPARIVQVFTNLLDSAAKYTPAGGKIGLVRGSKMTMWSPGPRKLFYRPMIPSRS